MVRCHFCWKRHCFLVHERYFCWDDPKLVNCWEQDSIVAEEGFYFPLDSCDLHLEKMEIGDVHSWRELEFLPEQEADLFVRHPFAFETEVPKKKARKSFLKHPYAFEKQMSL